MAAYNEKVLKITFFPQENKEYTDTITLESEVFSSDLEIDLSGTSALSNYDLKDNIGLTWDMISFLLFSSYDKILEIWQSNKHLTMAQKKAATPAIDTTLLIPKISDAEKTALRTDATNLLPPWKR